MGRIGGKKRMAKMTKEQRTELARAAARARWDKKKQEQSS
jgi:hypothetical protein